MIGAVIPMGERVEPQGPILVAAEATTFVARCDYCTAGEGRDDVTVHGELPLYLNRKWARCPHGHAHLVLREGSDEARNFRQ